ncbi:hypothetical protein HRbin36_00897 [bacterium HR36]|nr:hypothetical protein HRbin36_00897 [bacterium HR36]
MTRETKVGLSIAGAVFVLVAGALVYKLYFLKPRALEVAEKGTAATTTLQVVPAKSESSPPADSSARNEEKPAPFQAEIRGNPEAEPPISQPSLSATQAATPTASNPESFPPPPPIIVENKPPITLPETEKVQAGGKPSSKPEDSSVQVRTTAPPSSEPLPSSPAPPPTIFPPPPSPAPVAPEVNKPADPSKPSAIPTPSPPPVPTLVTPKPASSQESPATGKPTATPTSPAVANPTNPNNLSSLPASRPNFVPGASEPETKPAGNPSTSPTTPAAPVIVPTPPPSDAFDRSYSAPPAPTSLVASRESKPKPEDAIPITVRPQTQPFSPPAPDAYPVKVAPQPTPAGKVEVLDYEVQRYNVRPGDTWESISRQKYASERFASALAQYNRERDPRVTQLSVGSTILLPPGEILQRRYPHLLGVSSATVPGTGKSPATTLPITPPVAPVSPTISPAPANSSAYKLYRVQPNDTIWLIAKRTLGSGDRWPEIFRLNRDVIQDVNQLSPGTVLRLPADARVDNSTAPR